MNPLLYYTETTPVWYHFYFVPLAEIPLRLPGVGIRDASPQALHHFTRFDQVNQLIGARLAGPNLGFMARLLALCSLPRTNPGNRH